MRWLGTADLDGVEPFGFADGISQPQIDWERQRDVTSPQIDYSNVVALGEFLLGYPNEYDKYTNRPLIDADPASRGLLNAEDAPEKKDVGRNGTYLVMRQLRQDVRGFWQFVNRQAGGNAAEAEKLAAAFVGRTRAGDPLVPIQEQPIPGIGPDPEQIRQNQFTFAKDPTGAGCPLARMCIARIRAIPITPDARPDSQNSSPCLVLVRKVFETISCPPFAFIAFCGAVANTAPSCYPRTRSQTGAAGRSRTRTALHLPQRKHFAPIRVPPERLDHECTKFSGLTGESDPLLGNREAIPGCPVTSDFTEPQEGGIPRVSGLPQFVTVRGGAYFFLPSLRALRYFAGAGNASK